MLFSPLSFSKGICVSVNVTYTAGIQTRFVGLSFRVVNSHTTRASRYLTTHIMLILIKPSTANDEKFRHGSSMIKHRHSNSVASLQMTEHFFITAPELHCEWREVMLWRFCGFTANDGKFRHRSSVAELQMIEHSFIAVLWLNCKWLDIHLLQFCGITANEGKFRHYRWVT